MKKNILTLFSLAILFTAVSCTTSSTESASSITNAELQESSTRSAADANQEEEFNLLLARKWQNESGEISLNLKIDGTFEGTFKSDNVVIGTWTVSEDQKLLSLKENKASDGKGENLNLAYTILDMSSNNMKVVDEDGNEFEFVGN